MIIITKFLGVYLYIKSYVWKKIIVCISEVLFFCNENPEMLIMGTPCQTIIQTYHQYMPPPPKQEKKIRIGDIYYGTIKVVDYTQLLCRHDLSGQISYLRQISDNSTCTCHNNTDTEHAYGVLPSSLLPYMYERSGWSTHHTQKQCSGMY